MYVCNGMIIKNIYFLRYEFDVGMEILSLNYFTFPVCLPVRQINEMGNVFLVKQVKKKKKSITANLIFSYYKQPFQTRLTGRTLFVYLFI